MYLHALCGEKTTPPFWLSGEMETLKIRFF